MISIVLLISFLLLSGIEYSTYFEGAQFIHFLLGPATVALAIPLYDHRERVQRLIWPIMVACVTGIVTAVGSTLGIAMLMGASRETLLTLAPKSVTSPIAMGIAEQLGGIPSLAAGLVLLTGSIGCALGPWIFRLLRIKDPTVQVLPWAGGSWLRHGAKFQLYRCAGWRLCGSRHGPDRVGDGLPAAADRGAVWYLRSQNGCEVADYVIRARVSWAQVNWARVNWA